MSLGGLMIDAVWMAIEMHTFYPSRIACLFYRQWQSKASNKTNPRDAGLVINGGEGVRHIRQLSLANSYGYKRLSAHSNLSTQPSTHVMVTAQIHWGVFFSPQLF